MVAIQREEDQVLVGTRLGQRGVRGSAKALFDDGRRVMSGLSQDQCGARRQVLVELEAGHADSRSGEVRSRARSAA